MSRQRVRVAIGQALNAVGTLDFEARPDKQLSAFHYADEWLDNPHAFPVAPSLPLAARSFYASAPSTDPRPALLGVFADCAPDGWGRRLVSHASGAPPTEIEYLLAANDRTRHGALRFLDDRGIPLAADMPPVPRMLRLPDIRRLANAFETNTGDLRALAQELRGAGSALGGARPKSDFEDEDGVLHIAKYTTDNDTLAIERMEVATLALAGEVGLRATRAKLALARTSYPVALVRRFDRLGDRRIHYVSARTMLGFSGNESAHYTDLADEMRSACAGEDLGNELRELHRRILFSVLVSNDDDHLKNHGFLYAGDGAWRLSPAFDINPNPNGSTRLQTGISEQSGYEASIEAAVEAAPWFDLGKNEAWANARLMAEVIARRWRPLCALSGMGDSECDRYAPAFRRAESIARAGAAKRVRGSRRRVARPAAR